MLIKHSWYMLVAILEENGTVSWVILSSCLHVCSLIANTEQATKCRKKVANSVCVTLKQYFHFSCGHKFAKDCGQINWTLHHEIISSVHANKGRCKCQVFLRCDILWTIGPENNTV